MNAITVHEKYFLRQFLRSKELNDIEILPSRPRFGILVNF